MLFDSLFQPIKFDWKARKRGTNKEIIKSFILMLFLFLLAYLIFKLWQSIR